MLFNSIEFAIFLPLVFVLYWLAFNRSVNSQNLFLLVCSYIFYGWWDWRFLGLILASSVVDFILGIQLKKETDRIKRRILLLTSIIFNLGLLGFFKYYNFFIENLDSLITFFGYPLKSDLFQIILPVGISFYTFQTMSYTIDIYRNKLLPTYDFVAFAAYVSFFPQLVAGPIERAVNLLPQIKNKRKFEYRNGVEGMKQILWGLFKKIVVADTCAEPVNYIFNNSQDLNGSTLLLGAILFAFQIYGDFSGYSDIAIGTAKLFGINLMKNFAFPYFSRDIAEFWRRWHISLSTWFRDYVYIPLGGSRANNNIKIRNTLAIFVISGFWHGANWTFIIWGVLNALYYIPLQLSFRNRKNLEIIATKKLFPSPKDIIKILKTFLLTCLAWVFFRSVDLEQSFNILSKIFSHSLFNQIEYPNYKTIIVAFFFISFLIFIEWINRQRDHGLDNFGINWNKYIRWGFYSVLVLNILYNAGRPQEFIYFQF